MINYERQRRPRHHDQGNESSDFLYRALGDGAGHARLAIGVASLPGRMPVELELVLELKAG